ncbi:hypothetical protein HK097_003687, partial [Rhizophlyctis rosea]
MGQGFALTYHQFLSLYEGLLTRVKEWEKGLGGRRPGWLKVESGVQGDGGDGLPSWKDLAIRKPLEDSIASAWRIRRLPFDEPDISKVLHPIPGYYGKINKPFPKTLWGVPIFSNFIIDPNGVFAPLSLRKFPIGERAEKVVQYRRLLSEYYEDCGFKPPTDIRICTAKKDYWAEIPYQTTGSLVAGYVRSEASGSTSLPVGKGLGKSTHPDDRDLTTSEKKELMKRLGKVTLEVAGGMGLEGNHVVGTGMWTERRGEGGGEGSGLDFGRERRGSSGGSALGGGSGSAKGGSGSAQGGSGSAKCGWKSSMGRSTRPDSPMDNTDVTPMDLDSPPPRSAKSAERHHPDGQNADKYKPRSASTGRVGRKDSGKDRLSAVDGEDQEMVQCPICGQMFQSDVIGSHAAFCGDHDPLDLRRRLRPGVRRRSESGKPTNADYGFEDGRSSSSGSNYGGDIIDIGDDHESSDDGRSGANNGGGSSDVGSAAVGASGALAGRAGAGGRRLVDEDNVSTERGTRCLDGYGWEVVSGTLKTAMAGCADNRGFKCAFRGCPKGYYTPGTLRAHYREGHDLDLQDEMEKRGRAVYNA